METLSAEVKTERKRSHSRSRTERRVRKREAGREAKRGREGESRGREGESRGREGESRGREGVSRGREGERGRGRERERPADVDEGVIEKAEPRNAFLQAWVWKREGKPDRDRFDRPYLHTLKVKGELQTLTIEQARFKELGFASTVWDSSIVLSKLFEKSPQLVENKRCVELGAGCGLVGVVAAFLGASSMYITDLGVNIPLILRNCKRNGLGEATHVRELEWGVSSIQELDPPLDLVVTTDVLYDCVLVSPLLEVLRSLCGTKTVIYIAYGRNRTAEELFYAQADRYFDREKVSASDLDDVYQCDDVDVYRLRFRQT